MRGTDILALCERIYRKRDIYKGTVFVCEAAQLHNHYMSQVTPVFSLVRTTETDLFCTRIYLCK